MKTKKELIQKMLESNKEDLLMLEVREAYLQRKNISKEKNQATLMELANVQSQIREGREWIKYLSEE